MRSPCVMSRNLLRLHEERNWKALDMTQTVDSCTVANAKLRVFFWSRLIPPEEEEEEKRVRDCRSFYRGLIQKKQKTKTKNRPAEKKSCFQVWLTFNFLLKTDIEGNQLNLLKYSSTDY